MLCYVMLCYEKTEIPNRVKCKRKKVHVVVIAYLTRQLFSIELVFRPAFINTAKVNMKLD